MLFYQMFLLLGYAYAHWLATKNNPKSQWGIHSFLLLASALTMLITGLIWNQPVLPDSSWKPQGASEPVTSILQLLAVSIGLPFLLLSSTSPLLQKWVTFESERAPYGLYALSNFGSLLALITYPFVIEPNITLQKQAIFWSAAYTLFVATSFYCAVRMNRVIAFRKWNVIVPSRPAPESARMPYILWIGLSACGSLLLLATTNQLCRDVAVMPFLWVLPLTIYLLTFILCFEGRFYSRLVFQFLLIPLIVLAYIILNSGVDAAILYQVIAYNIVLFGTCMICHGELYRSRPGTDSLTAFYMCIAAGGALGGVFAGIIAPAILKGFWEYHLALWLTAFLMVAALLHDRTSWIHKGAGVMRVLQIGVGLGALAVLLLRQISEDVEGSLLMKRNFYGVLTVLKEDAGTKSENYSLRHGRIRHGYQFTKQERQMIPTSYYGVNSGVAFAIQSLRNLNRPLRVGVVGLGVGTIAAYGQSGDVFRFYDIDRDVAKLAKSEGGFFHYLSKSQAEIEIILGDGRITLESEAATGSQNYDLLAIDAFNSDSIPAHLLTREAMGVYLSHLKRPFGILALHVSNRFVDLQPIVFGLAKQFQLQAAEIDAKADTDVELASTWILIMFQMPPSLSAKQQERTILWTDNYHSILPVLKWND